MDAPAGGRSRKGRMGNSLCLQVGTFGKLVAQRDGKDGEERNGSWGKKEIHKKWSSWGRPVRLPGICALT